MKNRLSELWSVTLQMVGELETYLQRQTGKRARLQYKSDKQVRLLRLKLWSVRYKISVQEVLDLIVPGLRSQMQGIKFKKYGIGVGVNALTGKKAEEILRDNLRDRYPDNEHLTLWREQEKERQLERERTEDLEGLKPHEKPVVSLLESDSMEEFLTGYRDSIQKEKSQQDRVQTETWRKRKAYRGSPWR